MVMRLCCKVENKDFCFVNFINYVLYLVIEMDIVCDAYNFSTN